MELKRGSKGSLVKDLQLKLKALGLLNDTVDGVFGPNTETAVKKFEKQFGLKVDGIAGPEVFGLLDQASEITNDKAPSPTQSSLDFSLPEESLSSWENVIIPLVCQNAVYVPGRGRWNGSAFEIPCTSSLKKDLKIKGKKVHGFVCSTWVNFALGWWTRRNEQFTHGGGVPSLFDLMEKTNTELHTFHNIPYRGYDEWSEPFMNEKRFFRPIELLTYTEECIAKGRNFPKLLAVAQSTTHPNSDKVKKWWHHVAIYWYSDGVWKRVAADGSSGSSGYSGTPMNVEIMNKDFMLKHGQTTILKAYSIHGLKNISNPMADVVLEKLS